LIYIGWIPGNGVVALEGKSMRKVLFALTATAVLALNGGAALAMGGIGYGGGHGGGHGGGGGGGPRGAPFPIAALGLPLAAGLFAYVILKRSKN
jgi:hypothetical protein